MVSRMLKYLRSTVILMELLSFSGRLQAAMDAANLNQTELAKKVGLSRSAINQLIQGTSKGMKPENLVAVARALNVRVEWLAIGELPMRPDIIPQSDRMLLQFFHSLPTTKQATAFAVIRDMIPT